MKKDLIEIKRKNIFDKVKVFFYKIFSKNKKEQINDTRLLKEDASENAINLDIKEEKTIDFCQGIDRDMLNLQNKFHSGEIKSEDLSPEQIRELINLYNKQNKQLEISNELKKQKLLKYRAKIKSA